MNAQEGTWTLTAPDGRTWTADSPLKVAAKELRSRRTPEECLENILNGLDGEAAEDAAMIRDAHRYRFLRDNHKGGNRVPHISQYPYCGAIDDVEYPYFTKVGLDAAVDAAIEMTSRNRSDAT